MDFTKKMYVVMETIWYLRSLTKKQKLVHTDVEKYSCNFSPNKKPVSRQLWYNLHSRIEWQDIKKAIEGQLPRDHPVEQAIAEFGKNDKSGMFADTISELVKEKENLIVKLEETQKQHQEFVQKVYLDQYEESHFRINFLSMKTLLENLQKEKAQDINLLQNYQAELIIEKDKNKRLSKKVLSSESIDNAHYQLFEPNLDKLQPSLKDTELINEYYKASKESFEKMLNKMKNRPPEDVILIFHSFNTDIRHFIDNELPLRFPDKNYIYGCWDPSGTSRKKMYNDLCPMLQLLKPTVFILLGIDGSFSTTKPSNIVELPSRQNNIELHERLERLVEKQNRIVYDPILEGYEKVIIRRFS